MSFTFETTGIFVGALLTIAIFSFLYKENPLYRFAEHLVVGATVGIGVVYTVNNMVIPYVWQPYLKPIFTGNFGDVQWWITFPFVIGLGWLTRFHPQHSWLSRYPIAFTMGLSSGMGIPLTVKSSILVQLRSTMSPLYAIAKGGGIDWLPTMNAIIIFVGVLSVLLYFYFSKPHKGVYGRFTSLGIWILMISFGASFGFTVMARVSLLIGRLQFLFGDWLHII